MVTPSSVKDGAADAAAAPKTLASGATGAVDPTKSPYTGARYLYQQVRILSIGSSVRPQPGEAAVASTATNTSTVATSGGSIVFEVPSDAAQVIASIDPGSFDLMLIPKSWNLTPLPALKAEGLRMAGAPR